MEDSRKGKKDDEKGLSTSSPHVDKEKGKEAIVYKTKKGKRKGTKKIKGSGSSPVFVRTRFDLNPEQEWI